ncbi:MAG TPA: hypothetical protein PLU30_14640 [Verrucomicrobiae bacterium]|nr:hypothetical protein [Verrucomicrobiae bacterium]
MAKTLVLVLAALGAIASAVLAFNAKTNFTAKVDELKQTSTELAGTKKSLDEEKAKLQATTAAKEAAESKASGLETKLAATEKSLSDANTELTDTKGKLATAETSATEAKQQLENLKSQFPPDQTPEQIIESIKQKDNQIKVAQEEIDVLQKKLQEKAEKAAQAAVTPGAPAAGRPSAPGIQGKIVAVNHQWNFVVLNVGGERGLAENAEMVVVRGNQPIAKLKVAKVDPQTAVADIVKASQKVRPTVGDIAISN